MYEIFALLLEKNGVNMSAVSRATGIGLSTFTDWRAGRTKQKYDKLKKIADYFAVPVEYLMTGEMSYYTNSAVFMRLCAILLDIC